MLFACINVDASILMIASVSVYEPVGCLARKELQIDAFMIAVDCGNRQWSQCDPKLRSQADPLLIPNSDPKLVPSSNPKRVPSSATGQLHAEPRDHIATAR